MLPSCSKLLFFAIKKNKALFHGLLAYSRLFDIESVFIESCNEARQQLQLLQPAALIVEVTTSDAAEIRQFEPLSKAVPLFAVSAMTCETVAVAAYQNGAVTFIRLPCGVKNFITDFFLCSKRYPSAFKHERTTPST